MPSGAYKGCLLSCLKKLPERHRSSFSRHVEASGFQRLHVFCKTASEDAVVKEDDVSWRPWACMTRLWTNMIYYLIAENQTIYVNLAYKHLFSLQTNMYRNHLCTACILIVLESNQDLIFATPPAAATVAGRGSPCLLRLGFLAGTLHRGLVVEQLHMLLKRFLRPQARYFQPASIQAMAKLHSRRFLVLSGRNPAKGWDGTCLLLQVHFTSQHLVVVACLFDLDDDLASECIWFPQGFIFHQHNSAERKNSQATFLDLFTSKNLVGVREHQLRDVQQAFPAGVFRLYDCCRLPVTIGLDLLAKRTLYSKW